MEQTHHYYAGDEHFMLKQTISNIENFLFIFNPYTKYDLCRYWQLLEEKGYDPVNEYNKRLEMFDVQYSPTPRDLFIIMLQVSRFFKEFAEFETKHTPKFRHPFIRDKIVQKRNEEADIRRGRSHIDIKEFLAGNGAEPSKIDLEKKLAWPFSDRNQDENFSEFELEECAEELDLKKMHYLYEIGLNPEIRRMQLTEKIDDKPISESDQEKISHKNGLYPHEEVNIEVESGKVKTIH